MGIKKELLQPTLFSILTIIVLVTIDLNIPHIFLKIALLFILISALISSWFEKKATLDELTHKYEDMSVLMENIHRYLPDLVACKDKNLKFTMGNKALLSLFKLNKLSQIKGKDISNFFNEDIANKIIEQDNFVIKNGKITKYKIHSKENNAYYQCLSVPLKKGNNIKGIASIIRNITEEENLKEKLNSSYSQIKSVINNLPMVAYITDLKGNYIMGNEKSYKFYTEGIDPEFNNVQIDLTAIKDIQEIENNHVIKTKKTFITDKELKAIDGSYHWYTWRKVPLFDNHNEVKGIIIFIQNIDAIKNVQKQRDNYIATLSHDLKTPILAQIRTLELFLKGSLNNFDNDQIELLKLMLDSNNYMYSMVDTLVASYKYENGEINLLYENFNILTLIEECLIKLDKGIKASQIHIKVESSVKNPVINADKEQLRRVIENLIFNGITYGFKDSTLTILINEIFENNTPKICVKFINNSPYMTQETINNIFKKYVTHEDKFNRVGAGLGLYLFKQIIDAHKGNVFVTSSKDDINTFGFIINK